MDLQAFAKLKTKQVAAFERWWTQQHRKDKSRYALEISLPLWEEAFQAFVRMQASDTAQDV